ncbi:MAG: hypothetical protein AAFQ82_14685, partial [Myxococcota bacterium]
MRGNPDVAETSESSSHLQTVLISLAPTGVLLLLGFLLARGQGSGLDNPMLAAANAANLQALLVALGLVMSGGILWFRLQSSAGSDVPSLDRFSRALEREDFAAAAAEGRNVPGLSPGALTAISALTTQAPAPQHEGMSAALGDVRGYVDGVGIAMRDHIESVSQLDRALKAGLNAQDAIGDNVEGLSRSAEATSSS